VATTGVLGVHIMVKVSTVTVFTQPVRRRSYY